MSLVKSVIERLIARRSTNGEVVWHWSDLPPAVRASVAKTLLQVFEADVAAMDTAHAFQEGRLSMTTNLLIKLGTRMRTTRWFAR